MPRPASLSDFPAEHHPGYGPERGYAASIERYYDADTLVISADTGLDSVPVVWIRLWGVNAPELHAPGGEEALAYVKSIAPPGTHCLVRTALTPESRRQVRSFVRFVGKVVLLDGTDLGEALIDAGHGERAP